MWQIFKVSTFIVCAALVAATTSGCFEQRLIDRVDVNVAPNLETVALTLNFNRIVNSDLQGDFGIKNYGNLFVNPTTNTSPFQVGFRLNTAIVNDQDFAHFTPVTTLPNGVNLPMAIDRALVQVGGAHPINSKFDLYGYVDVLRQEWIGVAVLMKYLDQNFPAGLSISQGFMQDAQRRPAIVATVFGPRLDSNNQVVVSGGIALFGNIRKLIPQQRVASPFAYYYDGPLKGYYERNPAASLHVQEAFVQLMKMGTEKSKRGLH